MSGTAVKQLSTATFDFGKPKHLLGQFRRQGADPDVVKDFLTKNLDKIDVISATKYASKQDYSDDVIMVLKSQSPDFSKFETSLPKLQKQQDAIVSQINKTRGDKSSSIVIDLLKTPNTRRGSGYKQQPYFELIDIVVKKGGLAEMEPARLRSFLNTHGLSLIKRYNIRKETFDAVLTAARQNRKAKEAKKAVVAKHMDSLTKNGNTVVESAPAKVEVPDDDLPKMYGSNLLFMADEPASVMVRNADGTLKHPLEIFNPGVAGDWGTIVYKADGTPQFNPLKKAVEKFTVFPSYERLDTPPELIEIGSQEDILNKLELIKFFVDTDEITPEEAVLYLKIVAESAEKAGIVLTPTFLQTIADMEKDMVNIANMPPDELEDFEFEEEEKSSYNMMMIGGGIFLILLLIAAFFFLMN